jgi:hypothetical protein
MSLSLLVRRTVAGCLLALATPVLLFAQPSSISFPPGGSEYPAAGLLPGVQVHPQLSISTNGGFVVWEDNTVDGNGMGIRAAALDINLSMISTPFRVNTIGAREQESPQVALLNGGGAVFVWQGGRIGSQHIYARFTSASNTWLTADVQVNSANRYSQRDPAVASLGNGNVVVVWSSFNQAAPGSMQDIYAQLFSASGQKIGSEFLVNQTTAYNQRTPSIAALNGGGFVVGWVSEQQRSGPIDNPNPNFGYPLSSRPSVDIYARMFDVNGNPINSEFAVNTGLDVCANPSVAAGVDGGFTLAWSQRDSIVRSNSWDIFARSFSKVGLAGPSVAINAELYGDQYAPQASAVGAQYMIVWTSLGQDGSREGVYGRLINNDGTMAGSEFRVNTTTEGSQMHPAISSDATGQFLAVWTSYSRGGSAFDIFAQRYAIPGYASTAPANLYAPPPLDPFMTNSSTPGPNDGTSRRLDFPGTPLPAVTVVTNGTYNGLFYQSDGVNPVSAGYFTAIATASGSFSGKLMLAGRTYSLTGKFDSTGSFSKTITRPGLSSLTVALHLDGPSNQIRGTVSDGTWQSDLLADRMVYDRLKNPAPKAGSYTIVFPSDPQSPTGPGGAGFGTVKVDGSGNVLLAGTLADGTKLAQKSSISKQGIWPLYAALYGGRGAAASWVEFASDSNSDLDGQMVWVKPAGAPGNYYPGGFVNQSAVSGSLYTPPTSGARAMQLTTGSLLLSGGGLSQTLNIPISISSNNKITAPTGSKTTITLSSTTGLFKGTAINPDTKKAFIFQGALLEKANVGSGFFLGTNQSGQVYLGPTQ